jgi:hypothetical protein
LKLRERKEQETAENCIMCKNTVFYNTLFFSANLLVSALLMFASMLVSPLLINLACHTVRAPNAINTPKRRKPHYRILMSEMRNTIQLGITMVTIYFLVQCLPGGTEETSVSIAARLEKI